jgi:hypothetical protein
MKCVKTAIPERNWYLSILAQMLEDNGIPTTLHGEHLATIRFNYYLGDAGLKLCVLKNDDMERAIKLIEEFETIQPEALDKEDQYQSNTKRKWILKVGNTYVCFDVLSRFVAIIYGALASFLGL